MLKFLNSNILFYISIFFLSFLLANILAIILIPILRKIKFGQTIRAEGPKTHLKKMGIPTMGGFIFLIPITLIGLFTSIYFPKILPLLFVTLSYGFIGFTDDYIKVIRKNKDGLNAKQKTIFQLLFGLFFALYIVKNNIIDNTILLPYCEIHLPTIALIFYIVLILYATSNSVNLTDGIDGLNTSVTIVVLLAFLIVALNNKNLEYIKIFNIALIGGCFSFLLFNKHPASIIMGDTGSLALGGAVGALTILLKSPVILLFFGFIYIIETLSVIIQVTSFKLTGKRVFKMSPIHHHFELSGWKETKIVNVFVLITLIFCFGGISMYYLCF